MRVLTASATTTVHVYEQRRPGIPMTTSVSPKHSISLPFAADDLTGVGLGINQAPFSVARCKMRHPYLSRGLPLSAQL